MMSTLTKPSAVNRGSAGASLKADATRLASIIALIATYLLMKVLFFAPTTHPMRAETLNQFLVFFSGGIDTTRQRHAYLEAVVLIGATVLLAPLLRISFQLSWMQKVQPWLQRLSLVALVSFFVGTFWWAWRDAVSLILGLVLIPVMFVYRRELTSPRCHKEFRLIACLLPLVALLPGIFAPLDLSASPPGELIAVQAHYTLVVGQADRLAAGQQLFQDVMPGYSTILAVVFGGWQQRFGMIDFGGYVNIIRWMQAAFLLAALFLYNKYAHGWKLGTLMAIALVVPWYHFNQQGFLWPNNTPWRALGLPLALLALHLIRRRGLVPAAYFVGITAAFCVLLNMETGISITAGLFAYIWFRYRVRGIGNFGSLLKAGLFFGLGGATTLLVFMVACRLWLGYWPALMYLPVIWEAITRVAATGYSALKGEFYPAAVVIFAHAAFVLVSTALVAEDRLGFKQAFKAAVATTLIFWFAYYVNRPHPWNLVTFFFLYGFLLIDVIQTILTGFRSGRLTSPLVLAAAAILSIVIVPQLVAGYRNNTPRYMYGLEVARHGAAVPPAKMVSGVYIPADLAAELEEKSAYIKAVSKDAPAIYFTTSSFIMPKISGVQPAVPFGDTFTEVVTVKDYEKLLAVVLLRNPEHLYFDAPTNKLLREGWNEYYAQLRNSLSPHYEKEGEAHGWEVWKRKA